MILLYTRNTNFLISSTKLDVDSEREVVKLSRQVLNSYVCDRTITKQECIFMLRQLHLTLSTETFQHLSLSGFQKFGCQNQRSLLFRYIEREEKHRNKSLLQYFYQTQPSKKVPVVHGTMRASWPFPPYFCRTMCMLHIPFNELPNWNENQSNSWRDKLLAFVETDKCPESLKLIVSRAKDRFHTGRRDDDPVQEDPETSNDPDDQNIPEDMQDLLAATKRPDGLNLDEMDNNIKHKGLNYDWNKSYTELPEHLKNGAEFIEQQLQRMNPTNKGESKIVVPRKLHHDQQQIFCYVMTKLKEWTEKARSNRKTKFKPLRLTIQGVAGSGKSVIIRTIAKIIRDMFKCHDTVLVAAPTGTAAFNIGGETIHRSFAVPVGSNYTKMSTQTKENLRKRLARLLCLIIDERSMISSAVLARAIGNVKSYCHGGSDVASHCNEDCGGIPIILLFGDDLQLPPVDAYPAYEYMNTATTIKRGADDRTRGLELFEHFSREVMQLEKSRRQDENDTDMMEIQTRSRKGQLTDQNIERLMKLHLVNFNEEQKRKIEDGATHIFALHNEMIEHNIQMLNQTCSEHNPAAIIKAVTPQGKNSHYNNRNVPKMTPICIGAQVALTCRNIQPLWGLHNGAVGKVKGIYFKNKDDNPNNGNMPLFVAVHFPNYCGPAWIKNHPKLVPIAPIDVPCSKCSHGACFRKIIPLVLSWGRTIHKFQGLEAGPNSYIKKIVIHLGDRKMEGLNPGLTYTALSRAKNIGTQENNYMDSAMYFSGPTTYTRFQDLRKGKDGTYKAIINRDKWTKRLQQNTIKNPVHDVDNIIQWATKTRFTKDTLNKMIASNNWRSPECL